jgi:hypothetical protein
VPKNQAGQGERKGRNFAGTGCCHGGEAYTVAGNDNKALVIPAGIAFARAIARQPELNLYLADKRHPSLAGTYLAACVIFAALTGRSPVGNSYLAGIDPPTGTFLQNVAWETVQDYYGR